MFGNGIQILLVGCSMMVIGYLLWRSSHKLKRVVQRDPLKEIAKDLQSRKRSSAIQEMEIRLYEYGREVEGRVATTMTLLDHLVLNAEQEIEKLESLMGVEQSQSNSPISLSLISKAGHSELSLEQKVRIPKLQRAGLSCEEIARCLAVSVLVIEEFLGGQDDVAA